MPMNMNPTYGNWAGGIVNQYSCLGMVTSSGMTGLNSLGFQANMKGQLCKVWDGLHVSPTGPFKRAKICTDFCMVSAPHSVEDCPMATPRLQLLRQLRMGSHALLVEQGRLARPANAGICVAAPSAIPKPLGDESCMAPRFAANVAHRIEMMTVPCSVLCGTGLSVITLQPFSIGLVTPPGMRPHQPMLAERTGEISRFSHDKIHKPDS